MSGVVVLLVVCAILVFIAWTFNSLVRDRNQVHAAWADVDVQLQRRHDLVPALVASVRAYATHESSLLEHITAERSRTQTAANIGERGRLETALGANLSQLIAVAEAYPDLKANENFEQLSAQLTTIEDALQHARRFYNGSVRDFNTHLQRFPALLIAGAFRFVPAEFFAADQDASNAPAVTVN